jgi:hypothetical protein
MLWSCPHDILHRPARVVATAAAVSRRRTARNVLKGLSGVNEPPMIILMTTSRRPQQRYDHRLRDLVHSARDVTIATDLGVPRSTARGWLRKAPRVAVSLDMTNLKTSELQQEILELRQRVRKLTGIGHSRSCCPTRITVRSTGRHESRRILRFPAESLPIAILS